MLTRSCGACSTVFFEQQDKPTISFHGKQETRCTKPFSSQSKESFHFKSSGSFSHPFASFHAEKVIRFLLQRKKHTPVLNVSSCSQKAFQAPALQKESVSARKASVQTNQKNDKPNQTNENTVFSEQHMQDIPLLAKCISFIMKRGQKAKAARTMNVVLKMLQSLAPQNKKHVHALDMIHHAIHNVKPAFELRKARFGGKTQFIPATLPVHKQENQALRALVQIARTKHQKASFTNKHHDMYTFAYFLAQEIYDAYKHQGAACQAKHGLHKQAEHNRNHVRRRWW